MDTRIFKEINYTKKLAVSYSQLETFLNCPLRWAKYYLLGQGKSTDTESTELGTQIHASIESYCNGLNQGYEWSLGEVVDLVQDNLDKREIKFKPEDDKVIVDQHIEMAKSLFVGSKGLGKLLKQCEVVGQEIEFNLSIELPFEVLFNGQVYKEVILNGFIDLVLKDKETGGLIIVDHKTSKKTFTEDKLYTNYQFPIYQLVVMERYGRLPEKCYYYFTRFDELQEAPTLVYNNEDSYILKYFKSGKRKGEPKYVIKSVDMVKQELIDIFEQMYCAESLKDYPHKSTALCSWCSFSPLYGDGNYCYYAQRYIRKDIPVPRKAIKNIRT